MTAAADRHVITSPDEQTRLEIAADAGCLSYSVTWRDHRMLLPSQLTLFDSGKLGIGSASTNESNRVWKPVWGQFSQVRDHFRELILNLKTGAGEDVKLECRVFNDGLGLRFTSGGKSTPAPTKINFRTEYRWPEGSSLYWARGENEPAGPVSLDTFAQQKLRMAIPVVVDVGEGKFAALLESDLYSARQFSTMQVGPTAGDAPVLAAQSGAQVGGAAWQTPWRVLLFGRSPGELLVSTTPQNLAAECRLADASWIKPGKSVWDWRVRGYVAGDFRYGVDTASYLRFINFAATNSLQYLLIDGSWFKRASAGQLESSPRVNLPEIMRVARERGVGVLLYYDRNKGAAGDEALFPFLSNLGAVGTKYGFMGNDAGFTRAAIELAASNHLLIDFHDAPCPMTGVERTMPNAITREYCHSQQDSLRAFSPQAFLKMAMVNALTGPLDQANGAYGLNGINAGERERGPKAHGSYNSTVVSETARLLVIFSGLICLPDAPEEYAKKADLFEFIRRMPPATWDDTRIFNSRVGESITT
ncbi:MAG: glycoside hydrolase family 97 catalytic domain-containing protein, partial [Verrucomicrobiota bacterium]